MRFSAGGKKTIRNILDDTDYKYCWLQERIRVHELEEDIVVAEETLAFLDKRLTELEEDRKLLLKRLWVSEERSLILEVELERREWEFWEQVKRADHYRDALENFHKQA